jgi:predicted DNA-binding transcriptional regulator AlpA
MNAPTLDDIQPNTKLTLADWCQLLGADLRLGSPEDRVLTVKEWAKEAALPVRSAYEMISKGEGPPVVELSPNRIGIRVCDHRAWLAARTRSKTVRKT